MGRRRADYMVCWTRSLGDLTSTSCIAGWIEPKSASARIFTSVRRDFVILDGEAPFTHHGRTSPSGAAGAPCRMAIPMPFTTRPTNRSMMNINVSAMKGHL